MKLLLLLIITTSIGQADKQQRVISLSPALTEVVFELGAQEQLVGTTEHSNFPDKAKSITRVGPYSRPSFEKIVSLKPDLVLIPKEGTDTITHRLKSASIRFVTLNTNRLSDFPQLVDKLGVIFEKKKRAESIKQVWHMKWSQIPRLFRSIPVLIQIDHDPVVLAGKNTFLDDIINECGARNLMTELGYPKVNREALAELKPEVLVVVSKTKDSIQKQIQGKPKVVFQDPDSLSRLTSRLADSAVALCLKIQGGKR